VTDSDTMSMEGSYVTRVVLHGSRRVFDLSGDREEESKVCKGHFTMGPHPLFITLSLEAERITEIDQCTHRLVGGY
jgi:hypothetical protein